MAEGKGFDNSLLRIDDDSALRRGKSDLDVIKTPKKKIVEEQILELKEESKEPTLSKDAELSKDDLLEQEIMKEIEEHKEKEKTKKVEPFKKKPKVEYVIADVKERAKASMMQYLSNKLFHLKRREEKYTKLNTHILSKKWIHVLRKNKTQELKGKVEVLSQLHDRTVLKKDEEIKMLWEDLQSNENQYLKTQETHMGHVNELIRLQKNRIDRNQELFDNYLVSLREEFESELDEINEVHNVQIEEIKNITREMIKRQTRKDFLLDREFEIQKKSVKNKYTRLFHVMHIQMKNLIKHKERKMEEESREIGNPIQRKYAEYIEKRNENHELNERLKQQNSVIKKYEESLSVWKAKWLNNLREFQRRNSQLNEEIGILRNHFHKVKKKMTDFREGERRRLKDLVKGSKKTFKSLEEQISQASRIIDMHFLYEKYENEKERNINSFEEKEGSEKGFSQFPQNFENEDERGGRKLDFILLMNSEKLGKFLRKFNKVKLDTISSREEKLMLLDINKNMKFQIKKYLDGVSVNDEILRDRNALIMVEKILPHKNYIPQK